MISSRPRWLGRRGEHFVGGNRVTLLRDGAEAFPAMLAAIDEAREQVLLEMYWFDSDTIGRRFAEALMRARTRGVEVVVVYDSIGSIGSDASMFDEMAKNGVRVLEFNPVAPWRRRFRFDRLTRRDHRKILVVDGGLGFTGGINIADSWSPEAEEGGGWRDNAIRVEGPAVGGLVACVRAVWERERGEGLERAPGATAGGDGLVRVLGGAHLRNRREIVRAYLENIWNAKARVWISNSYFVPDRAVMRALTAAARRGVDVRVLQPGRSDVPIVRWASRAMWGKLLEGGVKIYEWKRNVLHSKTAVVDGTWSTIGTFNLDYLSLRRNLEVNVAVRDEAFGAAMEESFERDLAASDEVLLAHFNHRSLGERVLEAVAYRFRKLL